MICPKERLMGQMDRDYWRKRYNERTTTAKEKKPLQQSQGFLLRVWRWASSGRTIVALWLLIFVLHMIKQYR